MLRFLAPRWLAWHATAVAGAVAMVLLGRWQLHRGEATHSIQNYGYAAQWWFFAAFGVWFWAKSVRDAVRPPATRPARAYEQTGSLPVLAQAPVRLSAEDEADPEVVAYNRYLAGLAAQDRR